MKNGQTGPAGRAPGSPSGSGSAETFDYVYDGDDRLRRVTKKVAGAVVGSEEYWYDEQGARVGVLTNPDRNGGPDRHPCICGR